MNRRTALTLLLGVSLFSLNLAGCSGNEPVSSGGTPPEETWSDEVREAEAKMFSKTAQPDNQR